MRSLTVGELLGRIPVQAVPFEVLEGGRVVLLRPKFVDRRMAWLQRLLPRPEFRVRLDARGSFIWTALDGVRTGQGVCDAVRAQFGEEADRGLPAPAGFRQIRPPHRPAGIVG